MSFGMRRDLAQKIFHGHFYPPAEMAFGVSVVHDHPGDVVTTGAGIGNRRVGTESRVAPGGEFRQGHGILWATTGGIHALAAGAPQAHLRIEQRGKVAWMHCVSHLHSSPVETDVAEAALTQVRV